MVVVPCGHGRVALFTVNGVYVWSLIKRDEGIARVRIDFRQLGGCGFRHYDMFVTNSLL